jgi:hypothetical protein
MDKPHETAAYNFDEIWRHLDQVYANAQFALRYGATKESFLSQIEQAVELHEDSLEEKGWLIVKPAIHRKQEENPRSSV